MVMEIDELGREIDEAWIEIHQQSIEMNDWNGSNGEMARRIDKWFPEKNAGNNSTAQISSSIKTRNEQTEARSDAICLRCDSAKELAVSTEEKGISVKSNRHSIKSRLCPIEAQWAEISPHKGSMN